MNETEIPDASEKEPDGVYIGIGVPFSLIALIIIVIVIYKKYKDDKKKQSVAPEETSTNSLSETKGPKDKEQACDAQTSGSSNAQVSDQSGSNHSVPETSSSATAA